MPALKFKKAQVPNSQNLSLILALSTETFFMSKNTFMTLYTYVRIANDLIRIGLNNFKFHETILRAHLNKSVRFSLHLKLN